MTTPSGNKTAIETADGETLEALLHEPDGSPTVVAVATHPHPLYGGDMFNTAPANLALELPSRGAAVLRFNFRGVGGSSGSHGQGETERHDVEAAIDLLSGQHPDVPLYLIGYSFGADVALTVDDPRLAGWVAIAPPLGLFDSFVSADDARSKLILSPANDQFCDTARAIETTEEWTATTVRGIPGDHFLAGAMGDVVEQAWAFLAAR